MCKSKTHVDVMLLSHLLPPPVGSITMPSKKNKKRKADNNDGSSPNRKDTRKPPPAATPRRTSSRINPEPSPRNLESSLIEAPPSADPDAVERSKRRARRSEDKKRALPLSTVVESPSPRKNVGTGSAQPTPTTTSPTPQATLGLTQEAADTGAVFSPPTQTPPAKPPSSNVLDSSIASENRCTFCNQGWCNYLCSTPSCSNPFHLQCAENNNRVYKKNPYCGSSCYSRAITAPSQPNDSVAAAVHRAKDAQYRERVRVAAEQELAARGVTFPPAPAADATNQPASLPAPPQQPASNPAAPQQTQQSASGECGGLFVQPTCLPWYHFVSPSNPILPLASNSPMRRAQQAWSWRIHGIAAT